MDNPHTNKLTTSSRPSPNTSGKRSQSAPRWL
jgi:hypothetical protein